MRYALPVFALCLITVSHAFGEDRKSVQVTTPEGTCVSIDKIDGDQVSLKSRPGRCKSMTLPIVVNKDVSKLKVSIDGKEWGEQGLVAAAVPDMGTLQATEKSIAEDMVLPDMSKNQKAYDAGVKAGEAMNTPEYQARILEEAERIKAGVFAKEMDIIKKYYPDGKEKVKGVNRPVLKSGERVYVFISSSMPAETLRNYAISLDKAGEPNVVMVMRGMIGGVSKIRPTMDFIASVLVKDKECLKKGLSNGGNVDCDTFATEVLIDPLLYSRYNIFKVPAVVFATGVMPENIEMSEGDEENAKIGPNTTVYGDAALDAVLETIAENTKSSSLDALVKKMRTGYYN